MRMTTQDGGDNDNKERRIADPFRRFRRHKATSAVSDSSVSLSSVPAVMSHDHHEQQQQQQEQQQQPPLLNITEPRQRTERPSSTTSSTARRRRPWRRVASQPPAEVETREPESLPSTNEFRRTAVFSSSSSQNPYNATEEQQQESALVVPSASLVEASCTTAILQHSFLFCGSSSIYPDSYNLHDADEALSPQPKSPNNNNNNNNKSRTNRKRLSEDPTVQESIECVFASQLEEGLPHMLWNEENNDDDSITDNMATVLAKPVNLVSPASLLQARHVTRKLHTHQDHSNQSNSQQSRKTFQTASLVHVGTYDPELGKVVPPHEAVCKPIVGHSSPQPVAAVKKPPVRKCRCQAGVRAPLAAPADWPQRPLLLRPTPGSGTRVLGIRFSSATQQQYLWKPNDPHTWLQRLHQHWQKTPPNNATNNTGCPECMILPINNGNEPKGQSLVIDFETPLFRGTMLVRLRHSEGTTPNPYDDNMGYFKGMNRRYQIVVQGKFLKKVPWTECVAGLELERPCGKLPPKWIVKSALKVVTFFAPQLQARFDGNRPTSLSPLGSTPQMLRILQGSQTFGDASMEAFQEEPTIASETLLGDVSSATSSMARARFRKKAFDKLFAHGSNWPTTDPTKVYSFEFLQHLLNCHDFTVELGTMLGSIHLQEALDGQPLQIMARAGGRGDLHNSSEPFVRNQQHTIWAFDVWHECLYADSVRHDDKHK